MAGTYTCIESFCGAGGLGLGLHLAGFRIEAAFDWDEYAIQTYRSNLSENAFVADATGVSGNALLQISNLERGQLDLFAGGPPCQGFSKQKRGAHLGDERNQLVLEYARLVEEIYPKFFMLENVSMLGQKRGVLFIEAMQELLQDYELFPHFYNAADYGLAQTRERFIVVGKRRDILVPFIVPAPTRHTWRTVGEVLDGLPEPPDDYSEHPDYFNHQKARITEINIRRFSYVPQGGGWRDIPPELRLNCHQDVDSSKGGWPDVYGRLRWDGQAPTITGGFDSYTRGRYGHPLHNRALTPREAARLQGFPDRYRFFGNRHQVRHQIGNAVPPLLAQAIGLQVRTSLQMAAGAIPLRYEQPQQVTMDYMLNL